ncbi:MAG: DUF3416 domain-containing protein [Corynebacterium sp.]|nr:DUF3416 domain-containing protein [Corynebacterium sp.]
MVGRLAIEDIRPNISNGHTAAKASVGELIPVSALVWREGHDAINATLNITSPSGKVSKKLMEADPEDPDRRFATILIDEPGTWNFRIDAWSDPYATWSHAVRAKLAAGQSAEELANDLEVGARLLTKAQRSFKGDHRKFFKKAIIELRSDASLEERVTTALSEELEEILYQRPVRELLTRTPLHNINAERAGARFNSWYELFPRSTGGWDENGKPVHGTFSTTADALPRIAAMGFDTVYLPPIHPIGEINRKGKNNTLVAHEGDVGSPWAIGSKDGGHDATHPELGTLKDFAALVEDARALGLEVALDLALQTAPDHPWASLHQDFFTTLPDGTIAYAENPPKKYQDIYPLNFDQNPRGIYAEVLRVILHWIDLGVTVFRVDNPHTKPANFWAWVIKRVHDVHPEIIFLAEAFTRPARLYGLAKAGFSQSYSYFTWKTTKEELTEFGEEISKYADVYRPNLFVNTPDILHESLQYGGRAMFAIRATLASTMAPLWGVYSGYELYEHQAVAIGSEEYLDSEKYQLRPRDFEKALEENNSLEPYIAHLNRIRRTHPALQQQRILDFHKTNNDSILAYSKVCPISGDAVLVVINLDPAHAQEATVTLELKRLGLTEGEGFEVHDLVTGKEFTWGKHNFVRLDPNADVAHILELPQVPEELREQLTWRHTSEYLN